ncbi:hypothetical protein MVEN_02014200 [Mycena venus]|uniref:Peptidase C14 caspase domain-containing protein n=1 Tax=Mycena venus TaxID=2733690 RepID=A0A8H6XCE8_9AGAR|nr:hypothetical protein MVEN_02014200 [Mycena venus]
MQGQDHVVLENQDQAGGNWAIQRCFHKIKSCQSHVVSQKGFSRMEPKERVEATGSNIVHIQEPSHDIRFVSDKVHLEIFGESRCPVFMLIIGIDEYRSPNIRNLKGCANDAQNINTYLTHRFHVPEAQIACLINEQATRAAILEKFQTHLIHNPSIEKNDTIIIYYAGHGSRATAPASWPSGPDGKIETLVPHDEREDIELGNVVHGIPDRTIHALLGTLASVKGNNITVILDCCYSASCTRGYARSMFPCTRCVETPQTMVIPEELDQRLLGPRSSHIDFLSAPSCKEFDSHVLMAACRAREQAYETLSAAGQPCGYFTDSLIGQLRGLGSNRITYSGLLDLLPALPNQNPQFEGMNKSRYMFEVESPTHALKISAKEDGSIEIGVGSFHGVVIGTQFVIEMDEPDGQKLDYTLVARSVSLNSCILLPVMPLKDRAFLHGGRVVVATGKNHVTVMKVYVHCTENPSLTTQDVSVHGRRRYIVPVDCIDNADLAIRRASEEGFSFTRLDEKLSRYAIPDVHLKVPIAHLPRVLDAVAHFNHFLGKHSRPDLFASKVKLEMYDLSGGYGADNLVDDNEVQLPRGRQSKYGIVVCNYSQFDLFPYLFRFDPASYAIEALYLPQPTNMPPLPAKSGPKPTRITVGYDTGGYAFQETAFLKLFVSTQYLDFGRIRQPAAVDVVRDAHGEQCLAVDTEMCGALDVAVTQWTRDLR